MHNAVDSNRALHQSGARWPKITEAVLHLPLDPSKAVQAPARMEKPQRKNWKFRPTTLATIYQTAIGTVTFYPTTFVLKGLIVVHKWFVTDGFLDAAGQVKGFHDRSVIKAQLRTVFTKCNLN